MEKIIIEYIQFCTKMKHACIRQLKLKLTKEHLCYSTLFDKTKHTHFIRKN